jgi:hypothetical protein
MVLPRTFQGLALKSSSARLTQKKQEQYDPACGSGLAKEDRSRHNVCSGGSGWTNVFVDVVLWQAEGFPRTD